MVLAEQPTTLELELAPGWSALAAPLDAAAAAALADWFRTAARRAVAVGPTDTADVEGHGPADATAVTVLVTLGDDEVVGHAFSLRFPSPEDAQRLRTRLAAGGLLVAALTVGSIAVGTHLAHPGTVGGAAVGVAPAAAPAPFVNRGLNADIRSGDIVIEEAAPAAPFVNRGLAADQRSGDLVTEEAGSAPVVHGEQKN
ncbi:MAG: hypothetical protein ACHQZR_08000 [Candidatus Limnocylindrales bacterium]